MDNNETINNKDNTKCKVAIIGGGMAGLSAAYHLTRNGCTDFKLLESRNHLGGRIIQININDEKVELGANWIHGVLGNPIYELAMHYSLINITDIPKQHHVVASTENGKQISFSILNEIYEAYLCFLKRCEEYYFSQYLPPNDIDSVGDHIRLEISLYLDKFNDPYERHVRELLFECLLKRETCISGCDNMSDIDLLELGSYTELQGGNITLPDGYSSILEPLSKDIPQDNVLLGHPVKLIKYVINNTNNDSDSDDSDITVVEDLIKTTKQTDCKNYSTKSNVEIICDNNKKIFAEHVICTIPLGVLKEKVNTLFEPPLPDYKTEAINKLLFGTVDKIILEYERPILNPNISEVLLLWEPDTDKPEGQDDLSKSWYKKIYSFSKISENLILGWISGKEAEYMETLSKEIIIDTCTKILRKFLNDPFIPKPKNLICTSWHSQIYTRGSYTSIGVGSSQIDIEYLAQPLYYHDKPILLFAGEHTHSSFYSTVHGAFLTGRTAAQAILATNEHKEIILDCEDNTDLSEWIQGLEL